MTALQYLLSLHAICHFWNYDEVKEASNSYLRRLLNQGAVRINGAALKAGDEVQFPIHSLVLYPNNPRRRTTLV